MKQSFYLTVLGAAFLTAALISDVSDCNGAPPSGNHSRPSGASPRPSGPPSRPGGASSRHDLAVLRCTPAGRRHGLAVTQQFSQDLEDAPDHQTTITEDALSEGLPATRLLERSSETNILAIRRPFIGANRSIVRVSDRDIILEVIIRATIPRRRPPDRTIRLDRIRTIPIRTIPRCRRIRRLLRDSRRRQSSGRGSFTTGCRF